MTHIVVFISDPSRIEIHSLSEFQDNWNENYRKRNPIIYVEIFHDTEEKCIEFCKKHKLNL